MGRQQPCVRSMRSHWATTHTITISTGLIARSRSRRILRVRHENADSQCGRYTALDSLSRQLMELFDLLLILADLHFRHNLCICAGAAVAADHGLCQLLVPRVHH